MNMPLNGLLITSAGAIGEIENDAGEIFRCHIRKNSQPVITGDRVAWELTADGTGIITGLLPRESLLFRPENKHKNKLIAANVDYLIIVNGPPPIFSSEMLDRYLIAAQQTNITPIILLNKIDLMDESTKKSMDEMLNIYQEAGYKVLHSSIHLPDLINQLTSFLNNKSAVLVGQSGVGKSSLIKILTQQTNIRTGDVSNSGLGKHTTTVTRLYHLPNQGKIIDSPGVREFGLWHVAPNEVQNGFLEFKNFFGECKFRNCLHINEPNCAIKDAVIAGKISPHRLKNYEKIVASLKNS